MSILWTINVTPRSRNTYLDTCSDFLIVFFDLVLYFFCFMIICAIVLYWIQIRELRVSPSLNRRPDPSVLPVSYTHLTLPTIYSV